MLDENLLKTCEREIGKYLNKLFARSPMIADALAKLDLIDDPYFTKLSRDELPERLVAVMLARAWFDCSKPPWAICPLPVARAACLALKSSGNCRDYLIGSFGQSLRVVQWGIRHHPDFPSYCRGLMASQHAPVALRNDEWLRQEFPPRRLCAADGLAFLVSNGGTWQAISPSPAFNMAALR